MRYVIQFCYLRSKQFNSFEKNKRTDVKKYLVFVNKNSEYSSLKYWQNIT